MMLVSHIYIQGWSFHLQRRTFDFPRYYGYGGIGHAVRDFPFFFLLKQFSKPNS